MLAEGVNPKVLKWARESCGLSLADAEKKVADTVGQWESEKKIPTMKQVFKASKVYKRPLYVFFYEDIPLEEDRRLPDYRKVESGVPMIDYDLFKIMRRLELQQSFAREVLEKVRNAWVGCISEEVSASAAAKRLRDKVNIGIAEQMGWKDAATAYQQWREALENQGFFVFHESRTALALFRGLSLVDDVAPMIVVNRKDSDTGNIFTLFHEVCHLMLGGDGMCDTAQTRPSSNVEQYCNQFAASFLIPESEVDALEAEVIRLGESHRLTSTLAKKYHVSEAVVLRRLHYLGLVSDMFFQENFRLFSTRRPGAKGEVRIKGHIMAKARNGRYFSELVLFGYDHGIINAREFKHMLGADVKIAEDLRRKLYEPIGG